MAPQRGILLQCCLRALLWDFVIALIIITQRPIAENVLRLTYYRKVCHLVLLTLMIVILLVI